MILIGAYTARAQRGELSGGIGTGARGLHGGVAGAGRGRGFGPGGIGGAVLNSPAFNPAGTLTPQQTFNPGPSLSSSGSFNPKGYDAIAHDDKYRRISTMPGFQTVRSGLAELVKPTRLNLTASVR